MAGKIIFLLLLPVIVLTAVSGCRSLSTTDTGVLPPAEQPAERPATPDKPMIASLRAPPCGGGVRFLAGALHLPQPGEGDPPRIYQQPVGFKVVERRTKALAPVYAEPSVLEISLPNAVSEAKRAAVKKAPAPQKKPASPQKKPAAAAAAAAPASRELYARSGDRIEVSFAGTGWLFLGPRDRRALEGVSFLGRESADGKTLFTFKAEAHGDFELLFQLQDAQEGKARTETVRLRVVPEEQLASYLAGSAAPGAPGAPAGGKPPEKADSGKAEKLLALGELKESLALFLKDYRPGDPELNERIAHVYGLLGESRAAAPYYERNLSADAPYHDRAVLGLLRLGLLEKDSVRITGLLDPLLSIRGLSIEQELLDVAKHYIEERKHEIALAVMREFSARYPDSAKEAEGLFLLGFLYEQETRQRDLIKARQAYLRVYEQYPESPFAQKAEERIRYLDRHFFNVQ